MSGQYPPPNPSHPFSRAAHHQRAPTLPPWGHHTPQPSGMNVMGNQMNFFGSPHAGLPNRATTQPWAPLQTHPKPLDPNPLYGLQMMRGPVEQRRPPETEYQQEESMDLSSHGAPDALRNGTELNGEDSIATSVIAPNPLSVPCPQTAPQEESTEPLGSLSVNPELLAKPQLSASVISDTSDSVVGLHSFVSKNDSGFQSSTVKNVSNTNESDQIDRSNTDHSKNLGYEQPNFHNFLSDTVEKPIERKEESLDSIRKSIENFDSSSFITNTPSLNTSQSLMDSTLSADLDDSKLVIAESSADDIFGASPDPLTSAPQETDTSEGSGRHSRIPFVVPEKTSEAPSITTTTSSDPHPSVENVEILLENMFNSQEETSCSSQTSNSSVPQSVIVTRTPLVKVPSPLKVEELAMTLAADDPLEAIVKEEKKEVKTDVMDEIEKKLGLLTKCGLNDQPKLNIPLKVEQPLPVPSERDSLSVKKETTGSVDNKNLKSSEHCLTTSTNKSCTLPPSISPSTSKSEVNTSQTKPEVTSSSSEPKPGPSQLNSEAGTSSNPFIEVESELEKMFAGIVEPAEEIGSDNSPRLLISEPKKSPATKKPAVKRKKASSRRASDNSLFGSSEETPTPKKKGRKRMREGGSEKAMRKTKGDAVEGSKKGKLTKDVNSDKLKGPFLRIEGPKESPASVVVMNSGVRVDDEDGAEKASARRKHVAQRNEWVTRKAGPVYSSSAMSARYNSDKADLSWVCVFCKRGPHCSGGLGGEPAGDLFGPYRVPATPPHDVLSPTPGMVADHDLREEQKRRGGGKLPKSLRASGGADQFLHKMSKKNKRSVSTDSLEPQCGVLAVEGGYEVWMHGHCAEWAPGLTLIGSQLVGLEDAVWAALRTRCTHCADNGAGISCVVRSCPTRMHFPCAVLSAWLLDTDTFIARCSAHRTRLRPS